MKVSVIIPVFNRVEFAIETLRSVAQQSAEMWECVVIDDGSDVATKKRIEDFCQEHDKFNYYQRPSHLQKGAPACRNYGASLAKGEYLLFLDSDDLLGEDCLLRRIKIAKEYYQYELFVFPVQVFHYKLGDSNLLWNKLEKSKKDLDRFLNMDNPWQTTATLWKKSFFNKIEGFDEELIAWQDWDIHVRALIYCPSVLKRDIQPDVFYRQHRETSISKQNMSIKKYENRFSLYKKIYSILRNENQLNGERKYLIAKLLVNLALETQKIHSKSRMEVFKFIRDKNLINRMELFLWKKRIQSNKNGLHHKIIDKVVYYLHNDHFLDTQTTYLNYYLKN